MSRIARFGLVPSLMLFLVPALTSAQQPNPDGPEFEVNTYTPGAQVFPAVAQAGPGQFVVVWSSPHDGSSFGIFGQRFDGLGNPDGGEFAVNTYTTSAQDNSAVAMNDAGEFVVVWESDKGYPYSIEVVAQRFDEFGSAVGGEIAVNTYTTNAQRYPAVAMSNAGNFVVVWQSRDGSGDGIYGQRFSPAGAPVGAEFRVNSDTANLQDFPMVAMSESGNFIVVWESLVADGDSEAVVGRRFSAAGNPLGSDFLVNSYTTDEQSNPAVAMNDAGEFVVAWESRNQDGSSDGIFAQRFDAAGAAAGGEFQVNTYTTSGQYGAAVGIDNSGRFVVAWESWGQEGGSDIGVFAQAYNGAGVAMGDEFQVNTVTTFTQRDPVVAMNDIGDFVVIWDSDFQQSFTRGIFGQRFAGPALFLDGFESGDTASWSSAVP